MAEDVEELVVRATPRGIDETSDELDRMSGKFDETAEEMGETTDLLGDLQQRFSGAFGAIVAGLAVATAGLLSQVPVIGEAVAGISSIVDALAFRMDKILRPAIGPIAEGFFDIANALYELDGPLGDLVDVLLIATPIVAGFAAAVLGAQVAAAGFAAVVGALSSPFLVAAAAVGLLVGVLATDFLGIRTALEDFLGWLGDTLEPVFNAAKDAAKAFVGVLEDIAGFTFDVIEGALKTIKGVLTDIGNFVVDVGELGLKALKTVLGGLQDAAEAIWGALEDIANFSIDIAQTGLGTLFDAFEAAKDAVDDIIGTLRDIVSETWDTVVEIALQLNQAALEQIAAQTGIDVQELRQNAREVAKENPEDTALALPGGFQTGGGMDVNLDGQRLNEQQSQYNDNYTKNGGRG